MTEILDAYKTFLDESLPADYAERYEHYRADEGLRRAFQVAEFENGWLIPEWPSGLGGRDLSLTDALDVRIYGAQRSIPRHMNVQGVGVVAPALRRFGTTEQREALLEPTLRGDEWWALGMSEPEAGSDLASLRTTATVVESGFRVNGQKIWTTQAESARWCTLYARTDPDAPKHRGITCLILDMSSPGVDTRVIRTAHAAVETFCEVFLDDVFIPAENVLGELNGGWSVAMSSLEHERDMIWINNSLEIRRALDPVLTDDALGDAELEQLGRRLASAEAIRLTGLRSVATRVAGGTDTLSALLKLAGSEAVQEAALFAMETGAASRPHPRRFAEYFESLAATIYGGTSEVQRNIIAERVLGLPRV